MSIPETPRSGMNSVTGPVAALSLRPMIRPSAAFSSVVVRIRVTEALWRKSLRSRNRSGTDSTGPKLTMSSAPSETTWGSPSAPATWRRSGPEGSTPPTRVSASSVVVVSSTPVMTPPRTSDSIVSPPIPVAWKTRTS
ncbi:MAG: hypothetical protein AVDCRST_MAG87-2459 [uncultured Thermomicrobiales bacterium]|uniref:Uncharacterized protein n=1 Tax=uncultured Thermomicrobiales bacterium TaxID=1645740 RepID=A0A6J4VE75_9BACT|nr:MAG: hypothetical protein AVDCRST_MAG87-2459 [uncultured Thermomicrobiales bacterium]